MNKDVFQEILSFGKEIYIMKNLVKIYRPYMMRPIVYKAFARFVVGLLPVLLWDRFINKADLMSAGEHGFFIIGFFLLAMAWFNYLRLDGLGIHHLAEREPKPKKKNHWHRDIVDFADEKIISFGELESDERTLCKLIANIFVGAVFVVLSILL